jgi:hypothetical protein
MIEVFKTNVQDTETAKALVQKLLGHFPNSKINFDLHDCDKILRVEGATIYDEKITEFLNSNGFHCEILD